MASANNFFVIIAPAVLLVNRHEDCTQLKIYKLIKAARKVNANAELAQVFADIFRAPTHEEKAILCAGRVQNERFPNVWSDAGARDARSGAWL